MPTRPRIDFKHAVLAGATLLSALQPYSARAALGEPEAKVVTDAQQLNGSVKSMERANYRVQEIALPSGTVLREFSVAGGSVFAVAWTGPTIPNLRQTLGQYFDTYAAAARAKHSGRNHLQVEQADLVVQSSGHMRAFTGRAYLPQALPAGTSLDDIH
jgi:hypothetical protein